jgi:hypothetical protein
MGSQTALKDEKSEGEKGKFCEGKWANFIRRELARMGLA